MRDLGMVLRQWRADAEALRRQGHAQDADALERRAAEVEQSDAEEWLTFLSEADAVLRSGHAAGWFRARREAWKRQGHARQVGRHEWTYRMAIVPVRRSTLQAAEAGRLAARRMKVA